MERISAIGARRPNRCTGMIARVRGVIAASASAGSIFCVAGSISTSTGRAPVCMIAAAS
jgi:hypothetical protein